jgi:succinoglycan biosynthesis protein ExoM
MDANGAYLEKIVVGVCTFNRPAQLRRLFTGISDAASQLEPGHEIDVVVVDDGAAAPARDVVAETTEVFPGDIRYLYLGSANVATARNAVLELATRDSTWLVLIDDDCVPEADWLTALFDMQRRTDADVVSGHVQYTTGAGAPRWLTDQPFCDFDVYVDGEEPAYGTTANALVRSSFIRHNAIRFRQELGRTGGEDMAFFHDVRQAGGRLRHAAKAVVFEELTPARERLGYQLYRQLWLGNNMAEINRHTREWSSRRLFLRGGRWAVWTWREPLRRLRRRQPPQLRWTLALSLRGIGLMLGVLGVRLRHRA